MRQTSIEAFEIVKENLGERQLQVYNALKKLEYATNTMIANYLNLPINCVTPRCQELRKKGLVIESHISRCPITKNKSTYWRLK
jgi:Mn-dependent DtxR family transcriptional regulator